ncbi:MAG: hypothetical protein VX908_01560 [Planctomycetota bacterium]|nr:hypothetical protein [Planctomycetota bacterium]
MQEPHEIQDVGDPGTQRYHHTQPGTVLRVVWLIVAGWLLLFAVLSTWVLYTVVGVAFLAMLLFHSLTVTIDDEHIRLSFGLGLFRKRIPLSQVVSCRTVRNRLWYGFGIRYVFDGWMWNVSGMDAVQLTYEDGHHFRIGTDEPEALAAAITAAIGD